MLISAENKVDEKICHIFQQRRNSHIISRKKADRYSEKEGYLSAFLSVVTCCDVFSHGFLPGDALVSARL